MGPVSDTRRRNGDILNFHEQENGTGYFSSFIGLPRCPIVDSKPSVAAMFACQSSLPNVAKKRCQEAFLGA